MMMSSATVRHRSSSFPKAKERQQATMLFVIILLLF
jgi:hypothetical protein